MIGRIWTRICQHIVRRGAVTFSVSDLQLGTKIEMDRLFSRRAGGRP